MASNDLSRTRLTVTATAEQIDAIERFRSREQIATRTDAVRLLLDIALDSVTQTGRRFWDGDPADPSRPPRHRAERPAHG